MKYHKFTNYFNSLSPSLEEHEEEIFFHHPVLPDVYCNQLGALYVDEDRYKVKQTRAGVNIEDKKGLVVAAKPRLVWECYNGVNSEGMPGKFLYHVNANVFDFTPDNLKRQHQLTKEEISVIYKTKTDFINASVKRFIQLEEKYEPNGFTKEMLFEMLAIPKWLSLARNRFKKRGDKPHVKRSYTKGTSKLTDEQIQAVIDMYTSGMGQVPIMEAMGWRSRWKVKKIINENSLGRNGTSE